MSAADNDDKKPRENSILRFPATEGNCRKDYEQAAVVRTVMDNQDRLKRSKRS